MNHHYIEPRISCWVCTRGRRDCSRSAAQLRYYPGASTLETLAVLSKAGQARPGTCSRRCIHNARRRGSRTRSRPNQGGPLQDEDDRVAEYNGDPKSRFAKFTSGPGCGAVILSEKPSVSHTNYMVPNTFFSVLSEQGGIAARVLQNLGVELNWFATPLNLYWRG